MPDTIELSEDNFDRYFDEWLMWISTERKFLPRTGALGDQPAVIMNTFFTLDAIYEKMRAIELKRQAKEESDGS